MSDSGFWTKFLQRFCVVFLIQLIIKAFDTSFEVSPDITFRGIVFTVFFCVLWMGIWYLAGWVNRRLKSKGLLVKFGVNLLLAFSSGYISNKAYELGDVYLFGNEAMWEGVGELNPELTFGLSIFYMLIYAISETVDRERKIKEEQLRVKELEKRNIQARFLALKQQIEPHFLFNSLSVLSELVYIDQDLASDFIVKLSKILRYVIERNEESLAPMRGEMDITLDYFFLLKARFKDALILNNNITGEDLEDAYLPPVSIQMLVENAVKHNKLTDKKPIVIEIRRENNDIIVSNNINKRKIQGGSIKKGLRNLTKRYRMMSDRAPVIEDDGANFTVYLPVLSKKKSLP
ncbi:hypothetical protein FUAX_09460 [Fulvitalea axinellae]|uniref:Signal transduction histidine kinase internal region domain-containing protein n=1 Tax=Fulvitalea axinellae TaxID=1182444 RepID=A0AAU9CQ54_9BACT|nr:hypothetical protein FUAX_09460 [Fulvitalea axinellae]